MTVGCNCRRPPPTVDITSAFLTSALSASETSAQGSQNEGAHQQDQLLTNLQVWGWSPLVIDLSVLQERDETSQSPLARMHPTVLKRQVESLFAKDVIQENPPLYAIYRGRKSESGGPKTIEPKQSWEVPRCSLHGGDDFRLQLMERWTLALHSVAMAVSRRVNWPHNLLVHDGHCNLRHSPTSPCNVDLLRVFFYDRIIPPPNTTPRSAPLVLGSSPHSDWGSLTVVWQDDVGGLQHFCVRCRAWVDVAPAPITAQKLYFVVHLGDVASLAMGHATAELGKANQGTATATTTTTTGTVISNLPKTIAATVKAATTTTSPIASSKGVATATPWTWPSPRHRVLCSSLRNRASLVYFCYPPPDLSLQDVQDGLLNYSGINQPTVIPYQCYSLLHNQSSGADKEQHPNDRAHDVYRSIRTRPLQDVFAEKWQQVQRGS